MSKIKELKSLLKDKAEHIKNQRSQARLLKSNGNGQGAHSIHISLIPKSYDYRNHHIAYCELRGKSRDQIEKPHNNPPNEYKINKIKEEYAWSTEEIERFNQRKTKHENVCIGQN